MKGTDYMLLFVFGLLIAFSVVITLIQLKNAGKGQCWFNFEQDMERIQSQARILYSSTSNLQETQSSQIGLSVGNCASLFGIVSKDKIDLDYGFLAGVCPKGYMAYIIGLSYLDRKDKSVFDIVKESGPKGIEFLKSKVGMGKDPICKALVDSCQRCTAGLDKEIEVGAEGSHNYCLDMTANGDQVSVDIGEGKCVTGSTD